MSSGETSMDSHQTIINQKKNQRENEKNHFDKVVYRWMDADRLVTWMG
jgi:hypothetical protein